MPVSGISYAFRQFGFWEKTEKGEGGAYIINYHGDGLNVDSTGENIGGYKYLC